MSRLITATPLVLVAQWTTQWATQSQEQARRNAVAACTVLAARRLERLEVEAYVTEHLAQRASVDRLAEPVLAPLLGVG